MTKCGRWRCKSNGAYVHDDDEFVELVNGSSSPIDLSGYMFFDTEALGNSTPAHIVPENTILLKRLFCLEEEI